jgi:hypothetical protein
MSRETEVAGGETHNQAATWLADWLRLHEDALVLRLSQLPGTLRAAQLEHVRADYRDHANLDAALLEALLSQVERRLALQGAQPLDAALQQRAARDIKARTHALAQRARHLFD